MSQQPGYGEMGIQGCRAALAFHGEGVFTQRTFRRGGVHTEALVDAHTGIASQIQGENVVLPLLRHGAADQLAELRVRPCAILLPEAAAFQGNAQLFITRQRIAGMGHLIVEKANGGEVGLDGAGGLALLRWSGGGHQAAELGCGRLRRCPVIRPVTNRGMRDTPYARRRTLTAAYRAGACLSLDDFPAVSSQRLLQNFFFLICAEVISALFREENFLLFRNPT